jgi:glutaredoxin-like protein
MEDAMGTMKDADKKAIAELFVKLPNDVKIVMFSQENECAYCKATHELLEEVAALSTKLSLEVLDLVKDAEKAMDYGVDKIPATILLGGDTDYGIRFYGVPAGYEFATLIQDIVQLSARDSGLPDEVRNVLAGIDKPVHMQVLVSPTCPYCPKAVLAAHKFAMQSFLIRSDMVEITEFPHLAVRYDVQGVPQIIINEDVRIPGALPELDLAKVVVHALTHQHGEGHHHGPVN